MKLIYTCPKCGTDLQEYIVIYEPPVYQMNCSKCGWHYNKDKQELEVVRIPYIASANYRANGNINNHGMGE